MGLTPRRRPRVWGVAVVAIVLGFVVAACGGGSEATTTSAAAPTTAAVTPTTAGSTTTASVPQTTVRFGGSVTWYGQLPVMVATEKDYFGQYNLKMDWHTILSSSDRLAALTSGDIDFSNLGRLAVISGMAQGNTSFYYFANIDDSPGNDGLYARPGINTIQDLKGKKVAANTSAQITLATLLSDNGMSFSDINYVNLSPSDMCLALKNGDVDAIDIWQPILSDCEKAVPDGKLLGIDTDTSIYKKFGTAAAPDIVIIRRDLVDKNPEVASGIAAAIFEGVKEIAANPDEAAQLTADKYFQKSVADVKKGFSTFKFYGATDYENHFQKQVDQMQWLSQWLYDNGLISKVPDVKQWAKSDFVLNAIKMMGS